MATGTDGGNGTDIREGLICPICMGDFGTVGQLLSHFEEAHNSDEDKDVLQSFKDFLGKAKKILKSDNPFDLLERSQGTTQSQSLRSVDVSDWDPQELGAIRSHWSDFRRLRNNRMDYYAAETNKLIIRLDKIVSYLPHEAGKRREHEQNVVTWVNDEDVKLCPQCASPFNVVLRRKHHCRVCGTVQCNQCSHFIPLSFARKLTNPSYVPGAEPIAPVEKPKLLPIFSPLKRAGSSTSLSSLSSLIDPGTGEDRIRVCMYCKQLLERREQQMISRTQKPVIVELYEEMRKYMDNGTQLMPTYLKMVDSLSQGESTYNLRDAQECRSKLDKIAEFVDGYSKKIQSLGVTDEKNPTMGTALTLQHKIRLSAVHFLKENVLGLPKLPSQEQLIKLQEQHRRDVEKRINQEKNALLERRQAEAHQHINKRRADGHINREPSESVSLERGWGVETSRIGVNDAEDPMMQQMQIIRNYIQQARRANRYDEVVMLEANLRDLELEHTRMQSLSSQ